MPEGAKSQGVSWDPGTPSDPPPDSRHFDILKTHVWIYNHILNEFLYTLCSFLKKKNYIFYLYTFSAATQIYIHMTPSAPAPSKYMCKLVILVKKSGICIATRGTRGLLSHSQTSALLPSICRFRWMDSRNQSIIQRWMVAAQTDTHVHICQGTNKGRHT